MVTRNPLRTEENSWSRPTPSLKHTHTQTVLRCDSTQSILVHMLIQFLTLIGNIPNISQSFQQYPLWQPHSADGLLHSSNPRFAIICDESVPFSTFGIPDTSLMEMWNTAHTVAAIMKAILTILLRLHDETDVDSNRSTENSYKRLVVENRLWEQVKW